MKTYLDHRFWEKLNIQILNTRDDLELETWYNFKKFLKCESDVLLNIPLELNLNFPLINDLTSGRGKYSKLSSQPAAFNKIMNGPLIFQNNISNADILFLLEPDDRDRLKKWQEKNGFLITNHENFLKSWMIYRQMDTTKFPRSFSVRSNSKFELNLKSFNELTIYKHPVTDLILADQYIFKNRDLLECNLPALLESVVEIRPNLNLSIFGSIDNTFEPDPEILKNLITKFLYKFQDIKIEIILNHTKNHLREHDRHLITNYFCFKPGDSFTLFKPNKDLKTKGTTIDIKSLFDTSEMKASKNTILNLAHIKEACSVKSNPLKINRLFNLIRE